MESEDLGISNRADVENKCTEEESNSLSKRTNSPTNLRERAVIHPGKEANALEFVLKVI